MYKNKSRLDSYFRSFPSVWVRVYVCFWVIGTFCDDLAEDSQDVNDVSGLTCTVHRQHHFAFIHV